jgi:small ligand-binding sensory domain FIST
MTSGSRGSRIASTISTHPLAAAAAGEVIWDSLERVGMHPDVALIFVGGAHADFLGEIVSAVTRTLRPRLVVAATSAGIIGGGRDVIYGAGVVLWCASVGSVRSLVTDDELADARGPLPTAAVLLRTVAGPRTGDNIARWRHANPRIACAGGTLSALGRPTVLLVNGTRTDRVILAFDEAEANAVGATRTRPLGPPMVATTVHGRAITGLDGRPALTSLAEVIAGLQPNERDELRRGMLAGVSSPFRWGTPDNAFIVTDVIGMQRDLGSVVLGEGIHEGCVVQLRVPDDEAAGRTLLDSTYIDQRPILGALTFVDRRTSRTASLDTDDEGSTSLDEWMTIAPGGVVGERVIGPVDGPHAVSALVFR